MYNEREIRRILSEAAERAMWENRNKANHEELWDAIMDMKTQCFEGFGLDIEEA